MQAGTANKYAKILESWLKESSSPDIAELIAKEAGFKVSALLGAKKRKSKLLGELVMVNTALAIHAVNQNFDSYESKEIIDRFLSIARESVFEHMENQDKEFKEKYELRMVEYFGILSKDKPALGLSFSFLKHLDLDPFNSLEGQVRLATQFSVALSNLHDILGSAILQSDNSFQVFKQEIQDWPSEQSRNALDLIDAIISDNSEMIDKLYPELTVSQIDAVVSVIRDMVISEEIDQVTQNVAFRELCLENARNKLQSRLENKIDRALSLSDSLIEDTTNFIDEINQEVKYFIAHKSSELDATLAKYQRDKVATEFSLVCSVHIFGRPFKDFSKSPINKSVWLHFLHKKTPFTVDSKQFSYITKNDLTFLMKMVHTLNNANYKNVQAARVLATLLKERNLPVTFDTEEEKLRLGRFAIRSLNKLRSVFDEEE